MAMTWPFLASTWHEKWRSSRVNEHDPGRDGHAAMAPFFLASVCDYPPSHCGGFKA
jgi:hypothetical protein